MHQRRTCRDLRNAPRRSRFRLRSATPVDVIRTAARPARRPRRVARRVLMRCQHKPTTVSARRVCKQSLWRTARIIAHIRTSTFDLADVTLCCVLNNPIHADHSVALPRSQRSTYSVTFPVRQSGGQFRISLDRVQCCCRVFWCSIALFATV